MCRYRYLVIAFLTLLLLGGTASAICTATFGSNNYIYVSTPCNISEVNQAINNDTRMNKSADGTTVYSRFPIQFNSTSTFQANNTDNVTILRLVTRSSTNQSNLTLKGNVEVHNLTITGWNETNWTVPDKRIWSLFSQSMSHITLSGSSVTGNITDSNFSYLGTVLTSQFGVTFSGTSKPFNISNLTLINNTYGLYIEPTTSNLSLNGLHINRSINYGLSFITTNNNISVNNSDIIHSGSYGIYYESLKDSNITNNNISWSGNNNIEGNPTSGGTNLNISYNTLQHATQPIVARGASFKKFNNSIFAYNNVSNNDAHGFWCQSCNNSQVIGNIAIANYYANFYFALGTSFMNVTNNTAIYTSGGNDCGIASQSDANNLTISWNNASYNENAGICLEDSNWSKVNNNTAINNGGTGISISYSYPAYLNHGSWYNTIKDNYITGNTLNAIKLTDANFTIVQDNTGFSNTDSEILLTSRSNNNTLISNNLSSSNIWGAAEYEINNNVSNTTIQNDYSNFQVFVITSIADQLTKVEFTDKRLFTSTTNNNVTIYVDNSSQIVKNQTGQHNYTIFNATVIPALGFINFTNNTYNTSGDFYKRFNLSGTTYGNISICDSQSSSNYDWKVNGTYLSTNTTNATGCMPPLNLSLNGQTQLEISITIPPSLTSISMTDVTETYYSSVEIIFGFIKLLIISWMGAVAFIFIKSIIDKGPIDLSIIAYSGVAVGLVGLILLFSVAIMNAVPK